MVMVLRVATSSPIRFLRSSFTAATSFFNLHLIITSNREIVNSFEKLVSLCSLFMKVANKSRFVR